MEFLTNEKLTIVGAAGMIGSNMAQTAIMMHLTPNICLYDPYGPGLEGVAEEIKNGGVAMAGGSDLLPLATVDKPSGFFDKRLAVCCAQIPHLQPEKYFLSRICRKRK